VCIGLVGFSFLVTFPKGRSTYDSLPGGGSNSLFLFCYFFLFVWLSLASLLWCVPLGVWLEFVVGFRLSFSFIHRKEGCVCVLTWGWNEDGEPPPSCEVGPSFRMMALLLLVLGVGFGGGSLPPFLR
jgi:hypothetical protein